jgi:hypothetical protein
VLKLDFGNNDALENAAINVDMPSSAGILDEETLFLQSIVLTHRREHPLGVIADFFLGKFAAPADRWRSQRSTRRPPAS